MQYPQAAEQTYGPENPHTSERVCGTSPLAIEPHAPDALRQKALPLIHTSTMDGPLGRRAGSLVSCPSH